MMGSSCIGIWRGQRGLIVPVSIQSQRSCGWVCVFESIGVAAVHVPALRQHYFSTNSANLGWWDNSDFDSSHANQYLGGWFVHFAPHYVVSKMALCMITFSLSNSEYVNSWYELSTIWAGSMAFNLCWCIHATNMSTGMWATIWSITVNVDLGLFQRYRMNRFLSMFTAEKRVVISDLVLFHCDSTPVCNDWCKGGLPKQCSRKSRWLCLSHSPAWGVEGWIRVRRLRTHCGTCDARWVPKLLDS